MGNLYYKEIYKLDDIINFISMSGKSDLIIKLLLLLVLITIALMGTFLFIDSIGMVISFLTFFIAIVIGAFIIHLNTNVDLSKSQADKIAEEMKKNDYEMLMFIKNEGDVNESLKNLMYITDEDLNGKYKK